MYHEAIKLGPAFRVGPVTVFIRRRSDGAADVVRLSGVEPPAFDTLGVVALHGPDESFDLDAVTKMVEDLLAARRATQWARSWVRETIGGAPRAEEHQGPNVRRFRRVATEQDGLAVTCGDRLPTAREGHREAARVLREMADNLERNLKTLGVEP